MTDERPAAQEALWKQLRTVEAPLGARERVRLGIRGRLAQPRRWLSIAIPLAATAVAAVALIVVARSGSSHAAPNVLAASGVTQGDRTVLAGDAIGAGPVDVGASGSLRVSLDEATVAVDGPARVALSTSVVELFSGRVEIEGSAEIRGPTCSARVRGKSVAELHRTQLVVTVVAGSAELVSPTTDCEIVELSLARAALNAESPRTATGEPAASSHSDRAKAEPAKVAQTTAEPSKAESAPSETETASSTPSKTATPSEAPKSTPSKTETTPSKADLTKTKMETAKTTASKTETTPSKADLTKTKMETAKTTPSMTETTPSKADLTKTKPTPSKATPSTADLAKTETARTETPKSTPSETAKSTPSRTDSTPTTVATKAEPAKTASSPKAAPSKVEPTKSETTGESLRIAGRVAAPIAAPTGDADLAAQTAAYREAHALREREPAAALAKLREIVKRWPRAAIRHEVDLAVIDALVRLGKTGDAKKAARGFIRDYPASARATEIRAIAEAP